MFWIFLSSVLTSRWVLGPRVFQNPRATTTTNAAVARKAATESRLARIFLSSARILQGSQVIPEDSRRNGQRYGNLGNEARSEVASKIKRQEGNHVADHDSCRYQEGDVSEPFPDAGLQFFWCLPGLGENHAHHVQVERESDQEACQFR